MTLERKRAVLRAAYQASLSGFVKRAWLVHHPKPPSWGWVQQTICDHLEAVADGSIRRLIINVPPGFAKSLLVSVFFPAWLWAGGHRKWQSPRTQVLSVSATPQVVYRDAVRCRDVVLSDWYQQTLRPSWQLDPEQNAKSAYRFIAADGARLGGRTSQSTGSKVTGLRADIIVIDDPLDADHAYSDSAELEAHTRWYDQSLSTRTNSEETAFVLVMQRLHERDLTGHLLARESADWTHLFLSAEYDPSRVCVTSLGSVDRRTETGELLDPAVLSRKALDRQRVTLGPRKYTGQYLQRPSPASGAMFQVEWFKFWHRITLPDRFDFVWSSWDLTFKKSADSDYVAGQVWASLGAERYLLWGIKRKLSVAGTVHTIRQVVARFPRCSAHLIEAAAASPSVIAELRRDVSGIQAINHHGETKESRVDACLPAFEAGQVFFPAITEQEGQWVRDELIPELLAFPEGAHDDQVDSLTQALIYGAERAERRGNVFDKL